MPNNIQKAVKSVRLVQLFSSTPYSNGSWVMVAKKLLVFESADKKVVAWIRMRRSLYCSIEV